MRGKIEGLVCLLVASGLVVELKLKLILLKFMGRIILLSSVRLVGMVLSRAAAAVRQARRTRARLDAWIVREGAGSRQRLGRRPTNP